LRSVSVSPPRLSIDTSLPHELRMLQEGLPNLTGWEVPNDFLHVR
jgi:hypothetical protein